MEYTLTMLNVLFKGELHLLLQNKHVLCSVSTPWKIIHASYSKLQLPKELKNVIEILLGQAVFK